MIKKICLCVVFVFVFFNCDLVYASLCNSSYFTGDASIYDDDSIFPQDRTAAQDRTMACGPYFAYDSNVNTALYAGIYNNDTIRIFKAYFQGSVFYTDSEYSGVVSSTNNITICPDYLVPTNGVDKNKTIYDINSDTKNGYFKASSGVKNCKYSYKKNNSQSSFSLLFYSDKNGNHISISQDASLRATNSFDLAIYGINVVSNDNNVGIWFGSTDSFDQNYVISNVVISGINSLDGNYSFNSSDELINKIKEEINNFKYSDCDSIYTVDVKGLKYLFPSKLLAYYFKVSEEQKYSNVNYEFSELGKGNYLQYKNGIVNDSIYVLYEFRNNKFDEKFNQCRVDYTDPTEYRNCISKVDIEFEKVVERLSSYCNDVYSSCNYNDTPTLECLKIDEEVTKIRNDYGVVSETCGVSTRIWNFLANIFKWAKYLAPALVIILSIVDFIKAIASQSDDEIKKVQKRFVTRLVVAGLFFLLPFILEFVLGAFHLSNDDPFCNLI